MHPSRQQGQQFEQECDFLLRSQQLWRQDVINQSVRSFTFLCLSFSPKISLPLVSFWICSCWITSWSWLKKWQIKKDLAGITLAIFRLLLDCYSNNRWGRSSALSYKLFPYKKTEHICPTLHPLSHQLVNCQKWEGGGCWGFWFAWFICGHRSRKCHWRGLSLVLRDPCLVMQTSNLINQVSGTRIAAWVVMHKHKSTDSFIKEAFM